MSLKKLINYQFGYRKNTNKLDYINFIFMDDTIRYSFIRNTLFNLDDWPNYNQSLAFNVYGALQYFKERVDDESFDIIQAAFSRKLGQYL